MSGKNKTLCQTIISKVGLKGPRGLQGPTGPQGPAGPSNAPSFFPFSNYSLSEEQPNLPFETAVTEDGDYLVQLQVFMECNDAYIITSSVLKNSALDLTNINYQQQHSVAAEKFTYTHTARINGIQAGENVGFQIAATGFTLIKNGSLIITKIN